METTRYSGTLMPKMEIYCDISIPLKSVMLFRLKSKNFLDIFYPIVLAMSKNNFLTSSQVFKSLSFSGTLL